MAFLLTRLARREFSSTFTSNSTRMPVSISCPSNQSLGLMQVPVISPGTFSLCHDLPDSCDDSVPDYCDMEHRSSALDCPDGCTDGGCEGNRSGLRLSFQVRFRHIIPISMRRPTPFSPALCVLCVNVDIISVGASLTGRTQCIFPHLLMFEYVGERKASTTLQQYRGHTNVA